MINDPSMFSATYPWAYDLDARIRMRRVVDPSSLDPMGPLNRQELVELGTVYGREGSEYQNPNVWQGRGVLVYPNELSPGLVPRYGDRVAQSYAEVLLNVQATQHLAVIDER